MWGGQIMSCHGHLPPPFQPAAPASCLALPLPQLSPPHRTSPLNNLRCPSAQHAMARSASALLLLGACCLAALASGELTGWLQLLLVRSGSTPAPLCCSHAA